MFRTDNPFTTKDKRMRRIGLYGVAERAGMLPLPLSCSYLSLCSLWQLVLVVSSSSSSSNLCDVTYLPFGGGFPTPGEHSSPPTHPHESTPTEERRSST